MLREICNDIVDVEYHEIPASKGNSEVFIPDLIITGGQEGCDAGALKGARLLGLATGGYAPKGFKTEVGDKPELGSIYGLVELPTASYTVRTEKNVAMSDALILIAKDFNSPGTAVTKRYAFAMQVPCFEVPFAALPSLENDSLIDDIRLWFRCHKPSVLMIAGNRESKAKGIEKWTHDFMIRLFS